MNDTENKNLMQTVLEDKNIVDIIETKQSELDNLSYDILREMLEEQ